MTNLLHWPILMLLFAALSLPTACQSGALDGAKPTQEGGTLNDGGGVDGITTPADGEIANDMASSADTTRSPDAVALADAATPADLATHPDSTVVGPALGEFGTSACAPLGPLPPNATIVSPGADLPAIVAAAQTGDVIALEDGTYTKADIQFKVPGVTLRSVSGNPSAVIIDGQFSAPMILRVHASNTTIAEVTLTRAYYHLTHVTPFEDNVSVDSAHFYRVRFIDGSEQFLKVNGRPNDNDAGKTWTNDGLVECSDFVMGPVGRAAVRGNCYTGGIDVHGGYKWVVRKNYYEGIWCSSGVAEHAVHFWSHSRDTLVENNLVVDCARGYGFGLGSDPSTDGRIYPDEDPAWADLQHIGGIMRNNVVWATIPRYDTGIELQRVAGAKVLHNTVLSRASTATGRFSSLDYRWPSTLVEIRNNLVWRITQRDGASAQLAGNIEGADESWLEDVDADDFHLAATATAAINGGVADPSAGLDIDGSPHDNGLPDVGADER